MEGGWTPENTLSFISSLLGLFTSFLAIGLNLLQKAKVDSARTIGEENSKRLMSHDQRITANGQELIRVAANPVRYVVQQPTKQAPALPAPAPAPAPAPRISQDMLIQHLQMLTQQIAVLSQKQGLDPKIEGMHKS